MKQLKNPILLLTLCCMLLFASCMQPKPLVYKSVQHFGFQQHGLSNSIVTVDLNLYNPNKYSMKLKNTDVDVFVNNHHLGKALVTKKSTIPKLDTFSLPVALTVDLAKVLPNAFELLFNKEVTLKLTGSIKTGKHGIFISIPVDYEGKQSIR